MDPYEVTERYLEPDSRAGRILRTHGELVAAKAAAVAKRFPAVETDYPFLFEAALLHDIGMVETDAPTLGCYGEAPYLHHTILGRRLLEEAGYPRHALVCERHFLTGVSSEDIVREAMDLPRRDMLPVSWEETLICYADCYFSKNENRLTEERSPAGALAALPEFARPVFREWLHRFGEEPAKKEVL